jgi:hypothetical protein
MFGLWNFTLEHELGGVGWWQWQNGSWSGATFNPSTALPPAGTTLIGDPTPFERYFNGLLNRTFEYWGNGQPHVPLRILLQTAARYWNSLHAASSTQTYEARPVDPSQGSSPIGYAQNAVEAVMGPSGIMADQLQSDTVDQLAKINNMSPLTINTGPLSLAAAGVTAPSSPVVKAVAGTATGVVVGGAAAAGIYSLLAGKSLTSVVSGSLRMAARYVGL